MYISSNSIVATLANLSPLTSAASIGRSQLEARDNLAVCKSLLVALKASAFCSSFVPIKDVASTYTKTGTPGYMQVTVTAPCTNAYKKDKRQLSTLEARPLQLRLHQRLRRNALLVSREAFVDRIATVSPAPMASGVRAEASASTCFAPPT